MMKINLLPIEVPGTPIKEYITGMALGTLISIILGAIVLTWTLLP
jgi:hypothetical protein